MGFATFPVCPCSSPEGSERGLAFPGGATPFEAFPSAAGRSVSPRSDSLTPLFWLSGLGSARVATFGPASFRPSLDLRALLRCEVRCGLSALPPPSCPMLPWAWSQAGSPMRFPPSLRRVTDGRSLCGPKTAWGPAVDDPLVVRGPRGGRPRWSLCGPKTARGPSSPFVVRRPRGGWPWMVPLWSEDRGAVRGNRARRRPARGQGGSASGGVDLIRIRGPEGLWFRLRPSADWSRRTGRCSRLAGHPKAVALLAPRVVRTRRPRRVLVGRAAGHPRASGRRARVRPRGDAPLPS